VLEERGLALDMPISEFSVGPTSVHNPFADPLSLGLIQPTQYGFRQWIIFF
jgi:hypothetical protein